MDNKVKKEVKHRTVKLTQTKKTTVQNQNRMNAEKKKRLKRRNMRNTY